jgi:hypothetical protein
MRFHTAGKWIDSRVKQDKALNKIEGMESGVAFAYISSQSFGFELRDLLFKEKNETFEKQPL